MAYRYIEDIATADVAFEAWDKTIEEMFAGAVDATMNVMVEDLISIAEQERRFIKLRDDTLDMLLFQLLQEIIYYKDAQNILLRVSKVNIERIDNDYVLEAEAYGQELDHKKHSLAVDVKAVTLHRLCVRQDDNGWRATVVLDI